MCAVSQLVELSLQVKSDMSRRTLRQWPPTQGTLGQVPALPIPPTSAAPAAVSGLTESGPFVPSHTPSAASPLTGGLPFSVALVNVGVHQPLSVD